jgi:CBS-domain-containing membrane protein
MAKVGPGDFVVTAARKMRENHVGAVVVVGGNDRVVGMLTDRDVVPVRSLTRCRPKVSARYSSCARFQAALERGVRGRWEMQPTTAASFACSKS